MSKDQTLDDVDRGILRALQANARVSNAEIAREVGLAPSAVFERIKKMETRGVIRGYETRVDPEAVDLGLLAFIFVRVEERPGVAHAGEVLAHIPGVLEVHHIAGEDCYLVKVRAKDTRALGRLLNENFSAVPNVISTRTTVVLHTLFEGLAREAPAAAPEPAPAAPSNFHEPNSEESSRG
ncbi:MAG TPA: Lrp/AsnC family transcriptional regulator [Thermoanaerobaculia bacterium]|nr:Lrp/AsnC family transcriptional regulator [Thermoanaerobaculia bacterium]